MSVLPGCSSRRGAEAVALHLVNHCTKQECRYVTSAAQQQRLAQAAMLTTSRQLQQALAAGIGFHHAALDMQERERVEKLFLNKDVLVMVQLYTRHGLLASLLLCHVLGG